MSEAEDSYEDEFEEAEEEEEEEVQSAASPGRELSMDLEQFMALQSPSAAAYPSDEAELPPELRPLEGVSPLPNSRPDRLPTESSTMDEGVTDSSSKTVAGKEGNASSASVKVGGQTNMSHARSRSSKDGSISEADIKHLDAQIASLQSNLQSSLVKDRVGNGSGSKGDKRFPTRKSSISVPKAAATSGRRFLEKQSSTKKTVVSESAEIRRLTAEIQERDVLLDRLSKNSLKLAQDCDNLRVEVMRLRKLLKQEREQLASALKTREPSVDNAPRGNRESALLEAVSGGLQWSLLCNVAIDLGGGAIVPK